MKLADIKTLNEVSILYEIPLKTLQSRLNRLEENIDYRRLGKRHPTLISPAGVDKLIQSQYKYVVKRG